MTIKHRRYKCTIIYDVFIVLTEPNYWIQDSGYTTHVNLNLLIQQKLCMYFKVFSIYSIMYCKRAGV